MEYLNKPTSISCPVCEGQRGTLLYEVTSDQAANHFSFRDGIGSDRHSALRKAIEGVWGQASARAVLCGTCEFGYADPHVAGGADFYKLAFDGTGYPSWRWEFGETIEFLQNEERKRPRILEMGSGEGAFLKAVCPKITDADKISSIEYSTNGTEALEAAGFTVYPRDIRELDELDGKVDYLIAFHVVEHMDRPFELFSAAARKVVPGGAMVFSVPLQEWTAWKEQEGFLPDMPPNHIARWSVPAIARIAERTGWVLEEHRLDTGLEWKTRAIGLLKEHYGFQAQREGTPHHKVEQLKPGLWRNLGRVCLLVPIAVRRTPMLLSARFRRRACVVWAVLRAIES